MKKLLIILLLIIISGQAASAFCIMAGKVTFAQSGDIEKESEKDEKKEATACSTHPDSFQQYGITNVAFISTPERLVRSPYTDHHTLPPDTAERF